MDCDAEEIVRKTRDRTGEWVCRVRGGLGASGTRESHRHACVSGEATRAYAPIIWTTLLRATSAAMACQCHEGRDALHDVATSVAHS